MNIQIRGQTFKKKTYKMVEIGQVRLSVHSDVWDSCVCPRTENCFRRRSYNIISCLEGLGRLPGLAGYPAIFNIWQDIETIRLIYNAGYPVSGIRPKPSVQVKTVPVVIQSIMSRYEGPLILKMCILIILKKKNSTIGLESKDNNHSRTRCRFRVVQPSP